MPKEHLFFRALRWATIAVFLAASLELLRQIVFPAASAWQAHAAAILACASIVSVLNFGSLYKTKAQTDKFPENFIENLPEIACIIGDGGRFKQWNLNFEAALGYTAQEIGGITAFDTIAEAHRLFTPRTL
jgi:PAS domain-containing protein